VTYSVWWYAINRGTDHSSDAVAVVTFPAGTSVTSVISLSKPFPYPPSVVVLPDGSVEVVVYVSIIKSSTRQEIQMLWRVDDECVTGSHISINGKKMAVCLLLDSTTAVAVTIAWLVSSHSPHAQRPGCRNDLPECHWLPFLPCPRGPRTGKRGQESGVIATAFLPHPPHPTSSTSNSFSFSNTITTSPPPLYPPLLIL